MNIVIALVIIGASLLLAIGVGKFCGFNQLGHDDNEGL